MSFWAEEVARYEGRIQKITERPESSSFKCNKLLYEIMRDQRREQLKAWADGKPFAFMELATQRVGRAMGLYSGAMYASGSNAGRYSQRIFSELRNLDYPEHGCDLILMGLGLALRGDLPPPAVVVVPNEPCHSAAYLHYEVARRFECPLFTIDVPPLGNAKALKYVTEQLKQMIEFIEKHVPGSKYDEEKLVVMQGLLQRQKRAMQEIHRLKATVPCPISGNDAFRIPPVEIVDDPRLVEYFELFLEEVKERVNKGTGAIPNERLRFGWLVGRPFYYDPFVFLAKRGVAIPFCESTGKDEYYIGYHDDLTEEKLKRKLSPLEEEAHYIIASYRSGPAARRVRFLLDVCRDLKIDALVHPNQWGCSLLAGSSQILASLATEQLGIQTFMIERERQYDSEGFNREKYESGLQDFVDTVAAAKRGI